MRKGRLLAPARSLSEDTFCETARLPLAAPHAPWERLKHPQRTARPRCALIRARSARALRAPAAAAARHARPRSAGLPRPVVRPSRPCRACGAEAGRQAITGRPPGLRSPAPPYHRRGSSQGRNAAARRCLLGAGGDGERPGPAECPDYAEIKRYYRQALSVPYRDPGPSGLRRTKSHEGGGCPRSQYWRASSHNLEKRTQTLYPHRDRTGPGAQKNPAKETFPGSSEPQPNSGRTTPGRNFLARQGTAPNVGACGLPYPSPLRRTGGHQPYRGCLSRLRGRGICRRFSRQCGRCRLTANSVAGDSHRGCKLRPGESAAART